MAVGGDITEPATVQAVVDAAVDTFGGIDIVVNNAGYNRDAALADMTDDDWQDMLDVHATAPFRLLRAAAPHLLAPADAGGERFRKVVNVASSAVMGSAGQAAYAAGKSAVVGLTKSLAKEWAPHRVNVNAVAFGMIATRLTRPRSAGAMVPGRRGPVALGLEAAQIESAVARAPLGRPGTPEEAAGAVFLLCSPWSDWVTGQVLTANGGQVFGLSA